MQQKNKVSAPLSAGAQQRREAERLRNIKMEVNAATQTIQQCAALYSDTDRSIFVLGAIRGMLQGLIGTGEFATHASCFDDETTKALRELLDAIR